MRKKDVVFCILAGGRSSRFGKDKRIVEIGQKRVIDYVISVLLRFQGEIVISTKEGDILNFPFNVVEDDENFKGPLCGIKKVVENISSDMFVFLASDMPFISAPMLKKLLDASTEADSVLFRCGGILYPLPFVVKRNVALEFFEKEDCRNKRIKKLLFYGSCRVVDWSRCDSFFNVNTQGDLERARELLKDLT